MLTQCSPSLFVMCHMSRVTCHVSRVTCHVSHVKCHVSHVFYLFIYFPPSPPKKYIGPMIRIGREIQCLPYAVFLEKLVNIERGLKTTVPLTLGKSLTSI